MFCLTLGFGSAGRTQLEQATPDFIFGRAAIATGRDTVDVHDRHSQGNRVEWRSSGKMSNLLVSTRSLNMKQIDELVSRSSAKLGSVVNPGN
jgi:hypothetical protein